MCNIVDYVSENYELSYFLFTARTSEINIMSQIASASSHYWKLTTKILPLKWILFACQLKSRDDWLFKHPEKIFVYQWLFTITLAFRICV